MLLTETIDRQLQRLYDLFVVDGELNSEQYATLAMPLEESLRIMAQGSVRTTEDATQTGRGGEQPDETG